MQTHEVVVAEIVEVILEVREEHGHLDAAQFAQLRGLLDQPKVSRSETYLTVNFGPQADSPFFPSCW